MLLVSFAFLVPSSVKVNLHFADGWGRLFRKLCREKMVCRSHASLSLVTLVVAGTG